MNMQLQRFDYFRSFTARKSDDHPEFNYELVYNLEIMMGAFVTREVTIYCKRIEINKIQIPPNSP